MLTETTFEKKSEVKVSEWSGNALAIFQPVLEELWHNYIVMYRHFAYLNVWIQGYDQLSTFLPYLIAAPRLVAEDPKERLTYGDLNQLSNAIDHVYSSFSYLADNWLDINAFRSVLRRIREFEAALYIQSNGRCPKHVRAAASGGQVLVGKPASPNKDDRGADVRALI